MAAQNAEHEYPSWGSVLHEATYRILDKRMGAIVVCIGGSVLSRMFPSLERIHVFIVLVVLTAPFVYLTHCKFKLLTAALHGEKDTVQQLIASKADVNRPSHSGSTALSMAATLGHLEIAELLCGAGAHVDQGRAGDRPLLHASEWGHTPIVQCLLSARASVNLASMAGITPLAKAVQRGRIEVLQVLCDARACLNAKAGPGNETPLLNAIRIRNVKAVKMLCINGADRDEADQLAEVPTLRADAPGGEIANFLDVTKGFSTRLHYVEYLNIQQVHDLLRHALPASAHTAVSAAKRGAPESEACREFLRMWTWNPETHSCFPLNHRRFAVFLLLVSRRLVVKVKAEEGGCGLQRVFVAHIMPFVVDRTERRSDFESVAETPISTNAQDPDEKKEQ